MQRDGSEMDGNRRPNSPHIGENAPSPSKRPRLDSGQFNGPPGMMQNGRGQPMPGQQQVRLVPKGYAARNALLFANGLSPNLTHSQFQSFPGQQAQGKALQQYNNTLAQHQQSQMPNKAVGNPNGPQGQGSPMMQGDGMNNFYNGQEMVVANGARPQGGIPPPGQQNTGSHALQDYQMQLMLLEQQNKKRLLMARQEQDTITTDGQPAVVGPNGQPIFGTSPQGGPHSVNSPNPGDQMKRGTPQLATGGIPSPDAASRGSPANMVFMPGQMDPNMAQFYKQNNPNGMDVNMVTMVAANGMRPPSSHPGGFNNGQMNQQSMLQRQQAAQQAQAQQAQQVQQQQQQGTVPIPQWQSGPNAAPMMQPQGSQQSNQSAPMGTPQQRAMPPPSAPAASGPNGRTQPSSPQQAAAPPTPSQSNKANPKAKKETKPKVCVAIFLTYPYILTMRSAQRRRQQERPRQHRQLTHQPSQRRPRLRRQSHQCTQRVSLATKARVTASKATRMRKPWQPMLASLQCRPAKLHQRSRSQTLLATLAWWTRASWYVYSLFICWSSLDID